MQSMRYKTIFASLVLGLAMYGCAKKWENHNNSTDGNLTNNLYQAIGNTSSTAIFMGYLQKTGNDKLLAGSKTYTVWVPTDAALASMDAAVVADSARLSQFVLNHISNQAYTAGSPKQRVQMLNGKYIWVMGMNFDSANITMPNQYAKNGLFHIIDKFIPRANNIWEFLYATNAAPLMKSFLQSPWMSYNFFDPSLAIQTGVDPVTGSPIYQSGTGLVPKNIFLNGKPASGTALAIPAVKDVSDESREYTFIILADNSFTTELNKLTPYFKTGTTDSTKNLGSQYLIKDLAFDSAYSPSNLPDTLTSQYGVKVPINKANIVSATKTSNGWVYVMNQVSFNLNYKFPSIYVQGENPTSFSNNSTAFKNVTFYRNRMDAVLRMAPYNDILIINANTAAFWVRYTLPNMASMKYNAYWVVVNDYQTATWTQRLGIDSTNNATVFPYQTIASSATPKYTETLLGQFTLATYKTLNLYGIGPAAASSTSGAQFCLDYIRLEPAF